MKQELSICYYPTNVVLVDDNENFLYTISSLLRMKNPVTSYNTFSTPQSGLEYANNRASRGPIVAPPTRIDTFTDAEHFLQYTLNKSIESKRNNERCSELSVVVVGLDMPGIDGIEFCRQIQDPNVKKILLTGISAMGKVIQAFNDQVIHYYLNKSDRNMDVLLDRAITRLQREYFLDRSKELNTEVFTEVAPIFFDPAFADYFDQICAIDGITEYYFQTQPSRYHLKSGKSSEDVLIVLTDDDIKRHIQIMEEEDAEPVLIEKMMTRKYVPYFSTSDGYYSKEMLDSGKKLLPATIVRGKQIFYCAKTTQNDSLSMSTFFSSMSVSKQLH